MKTILVVDDDEHIAMLVKQLMKEERYKVLVALNGKDAVTKLRNNKVDLVLLDFFMPEMSGRDVAFQIKKDPKLKTKVVFLTVAEFGKKGKLMLDGNGIVDYIRKPFDNDELKQRVKKILRSK